MRLCMDVRFLGNYFIFKEKGTNNTRATHRRPRGYFWRENSTPSGLSYEVLCIFLWRYIKSKMYVKNYESINDLKAAII